MYTTVYIYRDYFKRTLDIFLSSVLLIFFSPMLICIIVLLAIQNKGSVFFYHRRLGWKERIFKIIKFKTMFDLEKGVKTPSSSERKITKLGVILRKTSLDELPQLLNVLKGEMSLVGPRPLTFSYLPFYSEEQHRRHEVRPGITGWAQINGRNSISWTKKFAYDSYYIDNIFFFLDLKILYLTCIKVISQEGINSFKGKEVEVFNGKN